MGPDTYESDGKRTSRQDAKGKRPSALRAFASFFCAILALGCLALIFSAVRPPAQFPIGQRIDIPSGTSLRGSAQILEQAHIVRSSLLLQAILIAQFAGEGVKAGVYQFDEPLSMFKVARAVASGTHGIPLVRVTIPEGLRNVQIDEIISGQLPAVEPGAFLHIADGKEGYLFPETYHVPETFTAEQFAALMDETFQETLASLESAFTASVHSLEEVVIMASILEREADSEESMKRISGILWKRIDEGIPLQVDASFAYLLGKKSEEVTHDDLKIDSPYNTYLYRGLPPTPLNNPGRTAIEAALSPTTSSDLYYLTAPDGTFYYAQTLDEHLENKARYLE